MMKKKVHHTVESAKYFNNMALNAGITRLATSPGRSLGAKPPDDAALIAGQN
jgi:hypothetical protein